MYTYDINFSFKFWEGFKFFEDLKLEFSIILQFKYKLDHFNKEKHKFLIVKNANLKT